MNDSPSVPCIAIDGPAASGKSTVARRVAHELGWMYVDSGALYRGVTWALLRRGIDPRDAASVEHAIGAIVLDFRIVDGAVVGSVDGQDPGAAIRGQVINEHVSRVAAVPAVRARIVAALRSMTRFGPLVMEGRDIGTAVFPASPHKFYMDADPEERARRRHAEMAASGAGVSDVRDQLQRRDAIDSNRRADPLRIAPDARVLDTTHMGIEAVVVDIVRAVATRGKPL